MSELLSLHDFSDPLQTLIEQYLYYAENVQGLAATTLKSRRIYLKQLNQYLFIAGVDDVKNLTNIHLDTYFVGMSLRTSEHTQRQITVGTVNTSKRAVKAFLAWCETYKEIPLKVRLDRIKERRRPDSHPDLLTHDEICRVIRRTQRCQDKLIISVMYEAGLRIQEIADMRIEHLRGRTLDVVGKGSKHRITFVSARLAIQLQEWMEINGWEEGHVFRPLQHGNGEGYSHTDTIRQRIKHHFREVVEKDMHPHQLRHAFALRLLRNGCDLRTIQKMLGHSKIETTIMYLNIEDDHLEREHARSFKTTVYA